jgi:hypothetical protein
MAVQAKNKRTKPGSIIDVSVPCMAAVMVSKTCEKDQMVVQAKNKRTNFESG